MAEDRQLLNLKQAARLLNVSEVSLRRWTNAGRLPCLRVGPKRERRFRREDLLASLEHEGASSAVIETEPRPPTVSQILLEGIAIDYGSHLCSLYESDLGRVKLAVPFLADGLEAGDVCFLVAAPDVQKIILDQLNIVRKGLAEDIADKRLVVLEGESSGGAMYDYLENAFVEATRSGNRGLRLLGDTARGVEQGMDLKDLLEFELRYDQFLKGRFPVVALCQYDARKFSGTAILDVLKCHKDTFRYPLCRFLG